MMVLDMMLQDRQFYPKWASRLRDWWEGRNRIVSFWVVMLILSSMCSNEGERERESENRVSSSGARFIEVIFKGQLYFALANFSELSRNYCSSWMSF